MKLKQILKYWDDYYIPLAVTIIFFIIAFHEVTPELSSEQYSKIGSLAKYFNIKTDEENKE